MRLQSILLAFAVVTPCIASAQKPFAGLYAGAAVSKPTHRYANSLGSVVPAGRAEVGFSWLDKVEAGVQVHVQPWRFRHEMMLTDVNAQPIGTMRLTYDEAAPAITALAFGRYNTAVGVRLGAGIGYSRTLSDDNAVRFKELELEPGVMTKVLEYSQGPESGGFAVSCQLGYKRKLVRGLAVAADVIGTYSAMKALGGPRVVRPYSYGIICWSVTAGVHFGL